MKTVRDELETKLGLNKFKSFDDGPGPDGAKGDLF